MWPYSESAGPRREENGKQATGNPRQETGQLNGFLFPVS
jgi:hypothetical protein